MSAQAEAGPILSDENYTSYVIILIIFILLSYFVSKIGLTEQVSAGGRVLGAVLGLYNGFVVITLVRDLLLGGLFPSTADMMATSVQPDSLSIQMTNMPATSVISGPMSLAFIAGGLVLFVVAITSSFSSENRQLTRRPPPLYGAKTRRRGNSKRSDD